jgi:hypothetical protein
MATKADSNNIKSPSRRAVLSGSAGDRTLLALCRQWTAIHDRLVKCQAAVDKLEATAFARIPGAIRRTTAAIAAGYAQHPQSPATFAEHQDWHAKGISPTDFISPREIERHIATLREAGTEYKNQTEDTRAPDGVGDLVIRMYTRRVRQLTAAERRAIAREKKRLAVAVRYVARARRDLKLDAASSARYRALTAGDKLLDKVARARARTPGGVLAKIAMLRKYAPDMARDGLSEYEEGLLAETILRDAAKMLAQPCRAAA